MKREGGVASAGLHSRERLAATERFGTKIRPMQALAVVVLVLHLAWIFWAIVGAPWTRGRPGLTAFHVISLIWGIIVEVGPWPCPLTLAEQWLEASAGMHSWGRFSGALSGCNDLSESSGRGDHRFRSSSVLLQPCNLYAALLECIPAPSMLGHSLRRRKRSGLEKSVRLQGRGGRACRTARPDSPSPSSRSVRLSGI